MNGRVKYLLWIPAAILYCYSYGQGGITLNGTVTDAATKKPLPSVNVYFNNTTIGASTDELGRFVIHNVPSGLSELTFSFVGYKTLKVPDIKLGGGVDVSIDVSMIPVSLTLAPITIFAGKKSDWSAKYKLFKNIFLGTTRNSAKTEILNPEVLSFEEIDGNVGSENFKARASGPLEIENNALGYHVSVSLEQFESIGTSYNIIINARFDTLSPASQMEHLRWKKNRLDAYKGSQIHLFRSIVKGSHEKEGFKIYSLPMGQEVVRGTPAQLADLVVDSTKSDPKILRKGMYQVIYFNKVVPFAERKNSKEYFPVSIIKVEDEYLSLYGNGQVRLPANFWWSGYLYDHRFGDFMPADYNPVEEEGELTLSARRERTSFSGTVVDGNGKPLSGVEVFVDNGLHHTTTNAWGQFELGDLYPGKYSIAFADDGMQEMSQIVDVSPVRNEAIVVTMKQKEYRNNTDDHPMSLEERQTYTEHFWRLMFRDAGKWGYSITNPQVLQFIRKRKRVDIWTTAPLTIENQRLGYEWTYFISDASIIRKKLHMSGLIKMDTIEARSRVQESRWRGNRLVEYEGSWNHLVSSLFDGRASDEGFHFYQLHKAVGKRKPRFSKLKPADIASVDPDSVLMPVKGKMFLHVLPGLEVHNENLKASHKFYRGISTQVLRLRSDSSYVNISHTGIFDPGELSVFGLADQAVPTVPVDDHLNGTNITDPDVLLYVQEENLKAVKNLLEKAYVQTDKPFYYPGDTIWFKAYLRYADLKYADSLSRVLYADLLDPQGAVLSTAVLKIDSGRAWGDISIASTAPPNDYYLRVYTSWMQNFDEFMIRPLPIISRDNFIVPGPAEVVRADSTDLQVTLSENNPHHEIREPIALKLQVLKNGQPMDASFSVSVTDLSAVPDLKGIPNILSLKEPFKAEEAHIIRLTYPLERSIVLHGKIEKATEKSERIVTTILFNGAGKVITPTVGPNVSVFLDFVDTTTAMIQCVGKEGIPSRVDIEERLPVQSFHLPDPLSYHLVTGDSYVRQANKSSERVQVLREVTVGAKRIINAQPKINTMAMAKFGTPYKILEGKDLSFVRLQGNLADYLSVRAPQFYQSWYQITNQIPDDDEVSNLQELPGARTFAGKDSKFNTTNLAATSVPSFTNPLYNFTLNGQPLPIDFVNTIPANTVSRIEVYWMPGQLKSIAIYTEPTIPFVNPNFELYKVRGFDRPGVFQEPPKDSPLPDYRTTIYWNPNITTGQDGSAAISFRASDVDGTYKISIDGMTADGEVFHTFKYLNIVR